MDRISWLDSLMLLFSLPIFFQLQGNLYTNTSALAENGWATKLPLPMSSLVTPILLLFLFMRKRINRQQIKYMLLWSACLILPLLVNFSVFKLKIILILILVSINFINGYALYDVYTRPKSKHWMLYCLLLFMLAHLGYSIWIMRVMFLSPHLFNLMIYDHLQYVGLPLSLMCMSYLFTARAYFFGRLAILLPIITVLACYMIASLSTIGQFTFWCFMLAFCFLKPKPVSPKQFLIFGFAIVAYFSYFCAAKTVFNSHHAFGKFSLARHQIYNYKVNELSGDVSKENQAQAIILHGALHRRIVWKNTIDKIFDGPKGMLLGHKDLLFSRKEFSAHNFYLDIWYNFGAFPIIFLLSMIFITLNLIIKNVKLQGKAYFLEAENLAYLFPFIFSVLIDNNFKISMRIPYSGMITFLLWGILIAKLASDTKQNQAQVN